MARLHERAPSLPVTIRANGRVELLARFDELHCRAHSVIAIGGRLRAVTGRAVRSGARFENGVLIERMGSTAV